MFGVGPALPSLEGRRKKSKKNKQAVNVLERMLAGEF
jgi:hypothetical protein